MVEPPDEAKGSRRLFFALWPADELRQRIVASTGGSVRAAGGRAIPERNYHVTLEFLGEVASSRVAQVVAAGAATAAPAFELELDRIEVWRRSKVLVLGASRPPEGLKILLDRLQISLLRAQVAPQREEYRPHLTLARNVTGRLPPQPLQAFRWPVTGFVLCESVPAREGSMYSVIAQWPLA